MKAKPPSPTSPRRRSDFPAPAWQNPRLQGDNRWQRVVRYGWDKGGAKGGRR